MSDEQQCWWHDGGPAPGPCGGSCDGVMFPVGNRMKLGEIAVIYECDTCMNQATYTASYLHLCERRNQRERA